MASEGAVRRLEDARIRARRARHRASVAAEEARNAPSAESRERHEEEERTHLRAADVQDHAVELQAHHLEELGEK